MAGKNHSYTVMIVPDRTANVSRYRVPRSLVRSVIGLVTLIVLIGAGAAFHYFKVVGEATEARTLKDENFQLRSELQLVQEKIQRLSDNLERVERLDTKLRMLTQLNDPDRNLAIGPLEQRPTEAVGGPDTEGDDGLDIPGLATTAAATDADIQLLHARLDNLDADARREETSLRELQEYFHDQRALLGAMPSIWPARGWLTSTFGTRSDPYTGSRRMHKGLDIAAQRGTPVVAPAAGTIVFAGLHGAYGKVIVVDHGYGVNTRYGHLSEIGVEVGDTVARGDRLGAVGNTGRSTGPHLHYEVRVNGIPEDPRKFILD